jgi:hypothetical protein
LGPALALLAIVIVIIIIIIAVTITVNSSPCGGVRILRTGVTNTKRDVFFYVRPKSNGQWVQVELSSYIVNVVHLVVLILQIQFSSRSTRHRKGRKQ